MIYILSWMFVLNVKWCFQYSKINNNHTSNGRGLTSPSFDDERSKTPPTSSPPPLKRLCKRSDSPINSSPVPPVSAGTINAPRNRTLIEPQVQLECYKDLDIVEVYKKKWTLMFKNLKINKKIVNFI